MNGRPTTGDEPDGRSRQGDEVQQPVGQPVLLAASEPGTRTVTAAPPAPATAEPAPAQQLAAVINPLRNQAGVHTLTVHLHPADLGPVTVTARVQGNDIHLTLGGSTDSGRDVLRSALPELRRELESVGFTSCRLDAGQGGSAGQQQPDWRPQGDDQRYPPAATPDTAVPPPSSPDPSPATAVASDTQRLLDIHA